jgi:hypothetical protein
MLSLCDPEQYIAAEIPQQIEYLVRTGKPIGPIHLKDIFPAYRDVILPMFQTALSIIEHDPVAVQTFCEHFSRQMFPISVLKDAKVLFNEQKEFLPCVWEMTCNLPQYVIVLSNTFISAYKSPLNGAVKRQQLDQVNILVAEINSLVTDIFKSDRAMTLARSTILIPHQADSALVNRARFLLEQAHNPSKMNFSIAELFDIVPLVKKNRHDLFKQMTSFLQHQLLSQVEPSVDLERQIVDSMGQFTEAEFLQPLQTKLTEFAGRYDDYNMAKDEFHIPEPIRIAVLSFARWREILRQGVLFPQYSAVRSAFERHYVARHKSSHLIWCDPSSVLQVRMNLGGPDLLFLFNGVQFAILNILRNAPAKMDDLEAAMQVDDLPEQIATLVSGGMVIDDGGVFSFNRNVNVNLNRNFARKYTSAQNVALLQQKEEDRNDVLKCLIVTAVKRNMPLGISIPVLVHQVSTIASHWFQVNANKVREQTRVLEVLRYIEMVKSPEGKDLLKFLE